MISILIKYYLIRKKNRIFKILIFLCNIVLSCINPYFNPILTHSTKRYKYEFGAIIPLSNAHIFKARIHALIISNVKTTVFMFSLCFKSNTLNINFNACPLLATTVLQILSTIENYILLSCVIGAPSLHGSSIFTSVPISTSLCISISPPCANIYLFCNCQPKTSSTFSLNALYQPCKIFQTILVYHL